ncbi:MAG: thiamine pyrophosphate-dependent enzyme [Dehalococcoidia bacterium]|nr:thiamine pyrophosphate-dependent enzyme [Dehalococcoidia bacterium]
MTRVEVLSILAAHRTNEIVVFTMSAMKEWSPLSPSPLNFQVAGAMGFASSVGLGLAMAQPDRRVIVLDGDGSLLMNLGTLVTISNYSPKNLVHFVFENGLYELPGQVPLPSVDKMSIGGLARAAGLDKVFEIDNLAAFREHLPIFMREPGPIFGSLKVTSGPKTPLTKASDASLAREMEKALRT